MTAVEAYESPGTRSENPMLQISTGRAWWRGLRRNEGEDRRALFKRMR